MLAPLIGRQTHGGKASEYTKKKSRKTRKKFSFIFSILGCLPTYNPGRATQNETRKTTRWLLLVLFSSAVGGTGLNWRVEEPTSTAVASGCPSSTHAPPTRPPYLEKRARLYRKWAVAKSLSTSGQVAGLRRSPSILRTGTCWERWEGRRGVGVRRERYC